MDSSAFTRLLHTRYAFISAAVVAAACTLCAYWFDSAPTAIASEGFVEGWGNPMQLLPELNLGLAALLNVGVTALLLHLNKTYNLLRAMTMLHGTFFLLMLIAIPSLLVSVGPSSILCLVVLWCINLLYMDYGQTEVDTRRIFLAFVLLSAGTSFDASFVVYIPVAALACVQLRIFTFKSLLAMILGILTPWIIFLGFGIVKVDELQWPDYVYSLPDLSASDVSTMVGTAFFTLCIAIGALAQNAIKYISYNVQSRAMMSVVTTLTFVTVVAMIFDYTHLMSYIVLLDCCAAFQIAHLFAVIHTFSKSYIAIIGIAIVYILIFVWSQIALILP